MGGRPGKYQRDVHRRQADVARALRIARRLVGRHGPRYQREQQIVPRECIAATMRWSPPSIDEDLVMRTGAEQTLGQTLAWPSGLRTNAEVVTGADAGRVYRVASGLPANRP